MGDVSAAFHVGEYASDPNSELRKIFSVRENQQDGLATILKYCQDKSRFKPGDVDTTAFKEVLQSEFSDVVTEDLKPTKFIKYQQNRVGSEGGVDDLVQHLPDNTRLKKFLASRPSVGNYDWSMAQFITEVEGDYLSLYVVELRVFGRHDSGGSHSGEKIRYGCRSVDRDEMTRRADDLVAKLREKERLVDWAKGMSSVGYH
ncbi:hypothetical protein EMPS_06245 [Entomortierella parvispora]|uniref:Uncharacterized protein n=1 Tax=Entomortierella parvispora TaxID=205924 RepID=A0A9P3HC29_9FUNG|nr:hypothetical protein EMPS_06245 [Entomortierella parvispora]